MKVENVAVFGGSFNPPTLAHSQVVREVINRTSIDSVLLLPSWERADKTFWIQENDRKKMIEIFHASLLGEWLNVDIERYFLDWSHVWLTTTIQEEQYLKSKLWFSPYFIYWTDVIPWMQNWRWNEDTFVEKEMKKIFISRPWNRHNPEEYKMENYILLDISDMLNLSSSTIREMLKNKESVENLLFVEIEGYIKNNKVYY